MSHPQQLLVDCSPTSLLLQTPDGAPVLPAFNQAQYDLYVELCKKSQADLTEVEGIPRLAHGNSEDAVYSSANLSEAASAYASLTNRTYRRGIRYSSGVGASVVLTDYESLNLDLLEDLYGKACGDSVPGIICINKNQPVLDQILYYAATVYLEAIPQNAPLIFNPLASSEIDECDAAILVGRKATSRTVRNLVREYRALKMVFTHSDGIDAFWGEQLSMCGVRDNLTRSDQPAPRCIQSGWCHRQQMDIQAALAEERLMSPGEVNAWILLWGVCWGVFVNDEINNRQWSVVKQFTEARVASAIVSTWTVEIFDFDLYLMFLTLAMRGITVGEIVRKLVDSPSGQKKQLRLCLLGDPRVRLVSKNKRS